MKKVFLVVVYGITFSVSAQRISNTALYRDVQSPTYFRIHYENDYFSGTDIYYTQGINFEYVNPSIENFFISKLLVRTTSKETKFGIALEHEGYTPTSILSPAILTGDRPFAACLFLNAFSIVNDSARSARISSAVSAGVIGPMAGGKEMQESIHHWINAKQPQGWQNQIQNDIILNYQMEYERGLLHYKNYFLLLAKAGARAGTLNTKAYGGAIFMAGYFDDPFKNFVTQKRKTQTYVYAEPLLTLVGHDATLQGGLFNNSNPYVIPSLAVSRMVYQLNIGLIIRLNRLQFEYFQSFLSKEFETGH